MADAGRQRPAHRQQLPGRDRLDLPTLPVELVSTENIKALLRMPRRTGQNIWATSRHRSLHSLWPPASQSAPTAPITWRAQGLPRTDGSIEGLAGLAARTRHARCGTSPACTVVADAFTSIVDLAFGEDGTLYVVELTRSCWFAIEDGDLGKGGLEGRSVGDRPRNLCHGRDRPDDADRGFNREERGGLCARRGAHTRRGGGDHRATVASPLQIAPSIP